MLDGWRVEARTAEALVGALAEPGVRAMLLATDDPTNLRANMEQAHARGIPVVVGCADDAARRRAVELHAEEWYRLPAGAEEISARIWSAVARGTMLGAEAAQRVVKSRLVDFWFLDDVRNGANEVSRTGDLAQQAAIINFALVQQFGRVEHVLHIDENTQALRKRAGDQSLLTRNGDGRRRLNISEVGGAGIAAGLSNLYRPVGDRSVTATLSRWGTQLLVDTLSNELREFWPDIRRAFHKP